MGPRLLELATAPAEAAIGALAPAGSAARVQAQVLRERGHRPWPVPDGPWLQAQTWCDLLFAHWPVAESDLRALVPPELPIDTFDGQAWVAVTPFEVVGLRLRGAPPLPLLSRFAETNVRTYTTLDGRPGIFFFSLDAASRAAVLAARATYRLPYFRARMEIDRQGDAIRYGRRSSRTQWRLPPASRSPRASRCCTTPPVRTSSSGRRGRASAASAAARSRGRRSCPRTG